jgi:hypothetical protein
MSLRKIKALDKRAMRWIWSHWNGHRSFYSFLKTVALLFSQVGLAYVAFNIGAPLPFQLPVRNWLVSHAYVIIILLAWAPIVQFLCAVVTKRIEVLRESDDLTQEDWISFAESLNEVVGQKTKRFTEYTISDGTTPAEVFRTITQPGEQIASLVFHLAGLMRILTGDTSLKMILANIENNVPTGWQSYMPLDKYPPMDWLSDNPAGTFFAYCARSGHPVSIANIAEELRKGRRSRYRPGEDPRENKGSIVCFPVKQPFASRVIYVLSIKSDNVDELDDEFIMRYEFIIDSYLKRIVLEANLDRLKKGVACR